MRALVKGMHFRGPRAVEAVSLFEEGSELSLEREPDNAYDAYAIKVIFGDLHIGYIEKEKASYLASEMDDGVSFSAVFVGREVAGRNVYPILEITPAEAA